MKSVGRLTRWSTSGVNSIDDRRLQSGTNATSTHRLALKSQEAGDEKGRVNDPLQGSS